MRRKSWVLETLNLTPAGAALKHLDGTVLSKDGGEMTFRVKAENGNRVRFLVSAATEFERIADFDALHKGMAIEVDYVKTPTGLVAKQVEPQD